MDLCKCLVFFDIETLLAIYLNNYLSRTLIFEPPHDKTNAMACGPSEDSDQPGHPFGLVSLRCSHEESLGPWLPTERTAKTLIRLGGCPGWSESSLGAHAILLVLSWGCSFDILIGDHKSMYRVPDYLNLEANSVFWQEVWLFTKGPGLIRDYFGLRVAEKFKFLIWCGLHSHNKGNMP